MIDAASQREKALQRIGDVGLDILRRHAGIERRNHHFGKIDGGEQVHWHLREAGDTDHHQGQTDHDDEVRITNGKAGHSLTSSGGLFLLFLTLVLHQADGLRMHLLARLQAAAVADNHLVTLVKT